MNWPKLVPPIVCKTNITVHIEPEGINKYGEPLDAIDYTGKCNYQDQARTVYTDERKLIQVSGTALFSEDICPDLPVIPSGTAIVFGQERRLIAGRKSRNPDGTVNFVEVWLS